MQHYWGNMAKTTTYIIEALAGLLLLVLVGYGVMDHFTNPSVVISEKDLIDHIHRDSSRIPHFVGMVVLHADVQTNTRQLSHMYFVDPEVKRIYENYFSTKIINDKRPLFLRDNDELNSRIVRLINHEFVCEQYEKTNGSVFAPTPIVVAACASAIPVSGIEFSGYVSVLMSKMPSEEEQAIIEMIIRDIADDVSPIIRKL